MRTITIANRDGETFEVNSKRPILDSLRDHGVDLPFGCKYGGCITCAAKLISGKVSGYPEIGLHQALNALLICNK